MKHLLSLIGFLCFSLFNEVIKANGHVFLYPPIVVAKYGHSVTLNCTTDVVTRTLFKFEKSGNAFQINGTNWICLNMTIDQWDINPHCVVNYIDGQNSSNFIITVFDFPENIIFEPLHEMEVNKTYNLTCTVPNVGPVQNLTIKILKGNEELIVQDYPHDNQKKHQNMTVSHPFTPQISDHGRNLSCSAELNLSSVGEVHCTNSSVNLKVYAFPENVTLTVPKAVEVNQTTTVKCEISNVHPPEDLKVQLLLNGTELTTTRHTVGHSVLAEARFSIQGGEQYLKCNATFRNMSIEKQEQVISYAIPVILICGLCGCIGMLLIFVIICRHLKKQNKLGRYNVLKAFLSTNRT
ncbi:intercellular adhesion molecule 1-like isoform X2 [Protopterus annectens]|uniref:intercellular adhesion molecule 1-like isoform X2 n=1 Tax=Protopterus annectens TaxID=7888 RepID=UPI001CF95B5F|nr:intercellular adhesion molecule 1-like isoform X2 [Protopterus annectens]